MAVLFRTRTLTSVGAALGSATCRDREQVMLAGRAQGLRFPSTCSLPPISAPRSGPWVHHEGRDHVPSTRPYLEGWGKAQNKMTAIQVGGQLFATLTCWWSLFAPPRHSPAFPTLLYVPGGYPFWMVSSGLLCSQVSRCVCPIGSAHRRFWGRREGGYSPGCLWQA